MADRFIGALVNLDKGRDAEPLIAFYSDDTEMSNITILESFRSADEARRFRAEYRGTFDTMKLEFRNVIVTSERTTCCTSIVGKPIEYDDVSILEVADETITHSSATTSTRAPLGSKLAAEAAITLDLANDDHDMWL